MRSIAHSLVILAVVALASAGPVQAQSDKFAALEAVVVEEMGATKTPGAAVAIVEGDRVVYAKGFGTTSSEGGAPIGADTLFRIGSTTKMFTAAAVAVLADRGKAGFSAPVNLYVPGLTKRLGSLTLHQLLSQSSGLRDMPTDIVSDDDGALAANVAKWRDDSFFTDPNTIYSYSSANFWLAGHIVEKQTGKPYADAMKELIFDPLGMPRSTFRPRLAMTYPLALGHNRTPGGWEVNRPAANNAAIYPGGSIFSSVNELSLWAIAMLNGGRVGGRQALPASVPQELMKSQFKLPGDGDVYYGYGLMGYEIGGVKTVSHGGVSRGYGATILFAPDQKVAVIVLANGNGQTLPKTRDKANQIMLPLKPEPETRTETADLTGGDLNAYAGTYIHAPQRWKVERRAEKLYVTTEGKEFVLRRTGKHAFEYEQGQILFVANKKGEFEHIFMGLYAARRVEE